MKNISYSPALLIFACSSGDNSEDVPLPAYTIEGKWIWSASENRSDAVVMYEFADGLDILIIVSLALVIMHIEIHWILRMPYQVPIHTHI